MNAQEREALRLRISEIRRAQVPTVTVECDGCGEEIPNAGPRRHYCDRACANRHWHVRNPGKRAR